MQLSPYEALRLCVLGTNSRHNLAALLRCDAIQDSVSSILSVAIESFPEQIVRHWKRLVPAATGSAIRKNPSRRRQAATGTFRASRLWPEQRARAAGHHSSPVWISAGWSPRQLPESTPSKSNEYGHRQPARHDRPNGCFWHTFFGSVPFMRRGSANSCPQASMPMF